MNYLKDREIWLSNVPTGNPPAGFFWKFIQNGKVVVRDSNGNNQIMVSTSGSQAITGSLTVTEGITGTVSSASYVEYSNVANKPTLVSGSAQVTYSGLTGVPVGIVSGSAQVADFGIFATTGSNQFNGSQAITGSLTVTGAIVAQTLNVQQVTSSVVFSSGSNIFGNELGNTQQFTGSVSITGSLNTSITAFGSAATVFLTSDSGTIRSRTAAQTLSDIAALPLAGGTLTGPLTGSSAVFSGLTVNGGNAVLNTSFQTGTSAGWDNNTFFTGGNIGSEVSLNLGYAGVTNDTFIKRGSNGRLELATGATARLTIASTGAATFSGSVIVNNATNDGVGALQVKVLAANQSAVRIASTTNNNLFNFISNDAPGNAILDLGKFTESGTYAAGFIRLRTDGDSWIQGGNVGIGTTSPHTALTIGGAVGTIYGINLGTQSPSWPSVSRYIGIGNSNGSIATNSGFSGVEFGGPDSAGEGYLAFHTHDNGVSSGERMRIDKTGNVGIGTSTITSTYGFTRTLSIENATNAEVQLKGSTATMSIGTTAGFNYFQSNVGYDFQIGGGSKFNIASTGAATFTSSVGIGGIITANNSNNSFFLQNSGATTGYAGAAISNSGGNLLYMVANSTGVTWGGGINVAYSANFGTTTNTPVIFATQSVGRMIITAGGNIGIGTATPAGILNASDASGATRIVVDNTANAAAGAGIFMRTFSSGVQVSNCTIRTDNAGNLSIFTGTTSDAEQMRITSGGALLVNQINSDAASGGSFFQLTQNNNNWIHFVRNSGTSGSVFGCNIVFSYAPNNTSSAFFAGNDTGAERYRMYSNGGLANYQANDVNLSDERTKKDITPLESYWDKFKAIEIVKFKYKDQTHDDFNIGVIAQQVEAVAPEFVDIDGWDTKPKLDEEGNEIESEEEPLKSIYTADLYHATIKVLQEAMSKIEEQQSLIESLKSRIEILEQ